MSYDRQKPIDEQSSKIIRALPWVLIVLTIIAAAILSGVIA